MEDGTIKRLLADIGEKIKQKRLLEDLQPEDVAEMTGLTAVTVRNIENGNETYFSNFVAVCQAINIHPKEILELDIPLSPRFELSQPRKEKSRLTPRIDHLIESDFLKTERTANEVVNELASVYDVDTKSSNVSVILNRKVTEGKLEVSKNGRINLYKKASRRGG